MIGILKEISEPSVLLFDVVLNQTTDKDQNVAHFPTVQKVLQFLGENHAKPRNPQLENDKTARFDFWTAVAVVA